MMMKNEDVKKYLFTKKKKNERQHINGNSAGKSINIRDIQISRL